MEVRLTEWTSQLTKFYLNNFISLKNANLKIKVGVIVEIN